MEISALDTFQLVNSEPRSPSVSHMTDGLRNSSCSRLNQRRFTSHVHQRHTSTPPYSYSRGFSSIVHVDKFKRAVVFLPKSRILGLISYQISTKSKLNLVFRFAVSFFFFIP
ncbi:hypothetical protein QQP08_007015 [Theobroma cacao]|nr:hypothetical protein QQP08_007015 [Theobroma cacao]